MRPIDRRILFDHPHRTLAGAVVASLAVHLLLTALPAPPMSAAEPVTLLSATITEMPPPPTPPQRPAIKRKPVRASAPVVAAPEALAPIAVAQIGSEPSFDPAPVPRLEPLPVPPGASAAATNAPSAAPPLPPRIELVYRGFLGTRGFFIGDAVYRLEHDAGRYTITTVAQARGLAALFLRGEGRLLSTGTITDTGLQPDMYSVERSSDGRHEAAMFDWLSNRVFLNGDKTAPLVTPTLDPLVVFWQFYFAPPGENETDFNVATTRRVYHAHFRRVGTETLSLPFRNVETEVWERDGGDGNLSARVWLAPSLHHVVAKMRLSNGRITGEVLLDSIRVDETVAQR